MDIKEELKYWKDYELNESSVKDENLINTIDSICDEYFSENDEAIHPRATTKAIRIGQAFIEINGQVDKGILEAIIMQEG